MKYIKPSHIYLLLIIIGIYSVIWLVAFKDFRKEEEIYASLNLISEKLELTPPSKPEINSSINIFTLKEQTKQLKNNNNEITILHENEKGNTIVKIESLKDDLAVLARTVFILAADENNIALENSDLENTSIEDLAEIYSENKIELSKLQTLIRTEVEKKEADSEPINKLWDKTTPELEALIASMTMTNKVGQLFIFSAEGQNITPSYKELLGETRPAGLILMKQNVSNEESTRKFITDLQRTNSDIPMFIAVDQEGGPVSRVDWDTTPGQKQWTKYSKEEVCEFSKQRAEILFNLGFNLNFAPVVDITNSSDAFINHRTISTDPKIVSDYAKEFVECSQEENIFATLKHFPGHGTTREDSHITLPEINQTKEQWLENDSLPYRSITDPAMIMTGHLKFNNLDNKEPATQSKKIISDILRSEFDYHGVVITDGMEQLHTSTGITPEVALPKVFNSGIDIALYVAPPVSESELIEMVETSIENGDIEEEMIDEALLRILKLKREIYFN